MVQVALVDQEDQGDQVDQEDQVDLGDLEALVVPEDLVVQEDQRQCHPELQTEKRLQLGTHLDGHMAQEDRQVQVDLGDLEAQGDQVVLVDQEALQVTSGSLI